MAPWWVTPLGVALTGLLAWAAQAWAKRGSAPDTLNNMAMGMVRTLDDRVRRLEGLDSWRVEVATIDRDHIDVLEAHIWTGKPPPPPQRPPYPARPA